MWKTSSVPHFPFLQSCVSECHLAGACSRLSGLMSLPAAHAYTHTHTHLADKWACLSTIDRIAARQPTSKSRRCPRRQEAWGPHRASSCMHGSVTRAVNCPSLVCFMGITQTRRNGGRRFIQPQGYSKEGRPNLGLQRFLMTTRNISIERQRK